MNRCPSRYARSSQFVAPFGAGASFWIANPGATLGSGEDAATAVLETTSSEIATAAMHDATYVRRPTALRKDGQACVKGTPIGQRTGHHGRPGACATRYASC